MYNTFEKMLENITELGWLMYWEDLGGGGNGVLPGEGGSACLSKWIV